MSKKSKNEPGFDEMLEKQNKVFNQQLKSRRQIAKLDAINLLSEIVSLNKVVANIVLALLDSSEVVK